MGFFEVFAALLAGLYALIPSYGIAIILLTLVTRIVLLPLSIKQTRSMREMQMIQPELKKIQAKYKGNRQKMNEEVMKLYKEHGVNPLGGCLPLLLQFPILIALFYVIRSPLSYMGYVDQAKAGDVLSWVPRQVSGIMDSIQHSSLAQGLLNNPLDLNRFLGLRLDCHPSEVLSGKASLIVSDVACSSGGFVPFLPYLFLILLMGFTTYYSQRQMQARSNQSGDNPQAAQMQMMGRIMPALFMFFAFNFPTGVILYWVTTNFWTIAQQRIMLAAVPATVSPGKKPGGDGQAKGKTKPTLSKSPPGGKATSNGGKTPTKASSRPHPSSKKKKKR